MVHNKLCESSDTSPEAVFPIPRQWYGTGARKSFLFSDTGSLASSPVVGCSRYKQKQIAMSSCGSVYLYYQAQHNNAVWKHKERFGVDKSMHKAFAFPDGIVCCAC